MSAQLFSCCRGLQFDAHFHDLSQSHSLIVISSWTLVSMRSPHACRYYPHWRSEQRAASGAQQSLGCSLDVPRTTSPSPRCCSCIRATGNHRSLDSSHVNACTPPNQNNSIPPATIQFFLATNRPARTGTSVSSNVFTIVWVMYDQMWTCPVCVSSSPTVQYRSCAYRCIRS
jgi:hypothetical protein